MTEETFDAGEGFDAVEAEAEAERQAEREAEAEAATTAALKVMIDDGRDVEALALAKHWDVEEWTRDLIAAKREEAKRVAAEAAFKNPAMQPEVAEAQPYQFTKRKLIETAPKEERKAAGADPEPEPDAKPSAEDFKDALNAAIVQAQRGEALLTEVTKPREAEPEREAPTAKAEAAPEPKVAPSRAWPDAPSAPADATAYERLLYPRGLLGHVVQYILDTDRRPDRPIALAAALVACHKALDRKILGPGDISVILFLILIGESGVGKQHAINCIRVILRAMGLESAIAGGGIASVQSIEEVLEGKKGEEGRPSALIIYDEYGSSFLSRILGQSGNVAEIPSTLQSLWGWSPKMEWQGSIKVGKEVKTVHGPAFSIFGISTEYAFFNAIKKKQISGGFVNRHLMIKAGNEGRGKLVPVKPKYDLLQCPEWLVKALKEVAGNPAPVDNRPLMKGKWTVFDFRKIGWGPGAEELCVAFEVENRSRLTAEERELWVRAHEIGARMATVQAVFRGSSTVDVDDIVWGIEFARYSTAQMGLGLSKHMVEEYEQAELIEYVRDLYRRAVVKPIGKSKPGELTHGYIRKACERKTKDLRLIDQANNQLLITEEIEVVDPAGAGRPTKGKWRWIGR
jgi:hypothetical protein